MYPDKKVNTALMVASLAALAVFWALIRAQAAVGASSPARSPRSPR
jgi:hypothetical protein